MITQKQLTGIGITAFVTKMLITFPTTIFRLCGNSAWLAGAYVTLLALGVFGLTRRLYTEKVNVITLAEKTGGAPLRIITGLLVFVVFALNVLGLMRIFPEITKLVLLQKTYIEVIGMAFFGVLIFCAYCGIEGIARVMEIFIPLGGIVFVAFLLMIMSQLHIDYLFPIMGKGVDKVLTDGISALSIFTDLLMLNILICRTKELDSYKKGGTRAIITGGVCAILIFLVYGMCYVYPASGEFVIPIYQMERLINLSDFFSRLEALFRFVWSIMLLLYSSLYVAVLSEVWTQTFRLTHSKPMIAPIVLILATVSSIPESLGDMVAIEGFINRWVYIPALLLPLAVVGLYKMFHVKHKVIK